jgi:hypothetical protein
MGKFRFTFTSISSVTMIKTLDLSSYEFLNSVHFYLG